MNFLFAVAGSVQMHSTVSASMLSSCNEAGGEAEMDPEVSNTQEMGYVCHQFSSELKRKFKVCLCGFVVNLAVGI